MNGRARSRLYFDSGMIIALFLAYDMHREGALRVLEAAGRHGCRLITSRLAIMEAVAVVRRKAAESHRRQSGSGWELAGVRDHVDGAAAELLEFVDAMKGRHGLHIVEVDDRQLDLALVNRKAFEHAGRVIAPAKRGKRYRHRGVGACDWLHFWLALLLGADMICTTDAAFADIAGNDDVFGHIMVQLTRGPLVGPLAGGGAA